MSRDLRGSIRPVRGRSLDPERGRAVAAKLRKLGIRGVLLTAAEEGYIVELACEMPECLCPPELGARAYFEEVPQELPDWMPTADHFPVLREEGGHRTVENVRLAHRLCNRVDYSKRIGRPYAKDLARVEVARAKAVGEINASPGLTVLVWNMGLGSPPARDARKNWSRLLVLMEEHSVDVALLNEVSTGLLRDVPGVSTRSGGREGGTASLGTGARPSSLPDMAAKRSAMPRLSPIEVGGQTSASRTRALDLGPRASFRCRGSDTSLSCRCTGSQTSSAKRPCTGRCRRSVHSSAILATTSSSS